MSFIVTQINIDDSSDKTITGTYTFDRSGGGTFIGGSGTSFPVSPVAGEWFWRTDTNVLYRRNDANSAWTPVSVAADSASVNTFGAGGITTTTTTRFLAPGYYTGNAPTTAISFRAPRAGTLKNLYIRHNTTGTGAANITYTVRVNATATALAVTMPPTTQSGADTTNTVSVTAGDTIDIRVTKAATISSSPNDIMASLEIV